MSHLTQTEAAKCVNGFFLHLIGRENYKRWKDLKTKVKFCSETAFVSWLLDSGEFISDSCNNDINGSGSTINDDISTSIGGVGGTLVGGCKKKRAKKAKKRSNSESSQENVTTSGTASDLGSVHVKSEADDDDDFYTSLDIGGCDIGGDKSDCRLSTSSAGTASLVAGLAGTGLNLDDFCVPGVTSTLGLGLNLSDDPLGLNSSIDDTIPDLSADPFSITSPYSSTLLNSLNLDQTFQHPSTSKGTKKFKLSDAQSREYEHVMELRKTFASVHKMCPVGGGGAAAAVTAATSCGSQFKLTYTAISSTTVLVSIGDKCSITGLSYPVRCDLCRGEELSSERFLVNHAKKCHQINPFLCEACSKRFATKPSIESHIFWSCSAVDSLHSQRTVTAATAAAVAGTNLINSLQQQQPNCSSVPGAPPTQK